MQEKELGYLTVREESSGAGSDVYPDSEVIEKTRVQRLFNFTQLYVTATGFMFRWRSLVTLSFVTLSTAVLNSAQVLSCYDIHVWMGSCIRVR